MLSTELENVYIFCMRIFLCLFLIFFVAACDEAESPPEKPPVLVLTPVTFAALPDWGQDDFTGLVRAFDKSCHRILKRAPDTPFGVLKQAGTYGDWQGACETFTQSDDWNAADIQTFFETNFTPYQISADDDPVGLFTGYYEASLKGSRIHKPPYTIPLYQRPDDLVMVNLGAFREDLKGVRIAGRVQGGNLKPYENRAEIVAGDWPHNDKALLWVDDAVDAFFVQIQGSGIVRMDDGTTARIGYAGQNGHPYYAIGRELIKMGALNKDTVSMQSIRAWLEANPDQADTIMNTNRSYVFFREITGDGPMGAEGVALTAERSLAVDRTKFSYGLPLWVDITHPAGDLPPLRRMMVAQDTGGAIVGMVRGDVFWGYGDRAEDMAGKMKSQGRYWVLLPKKATVE